MTCKAICERGFDCPKYATGACGIKAPAALSAKPMSVDQLRSALCAMPLTGDGVKNLQRATAFVQDYLYNQDAATAEGFIRQDVVPNFRLLTADAVPLKRVNREAQKAWKGRQRVRRADTGRSLPPWYKVTEFGFRFRPGVLAEHLAGTCPVIYAGEQYYHYRDGVYRPMSDMQAQAMVQEQMLSAETSMRQIQDAENQWRLLALRNPKDLNADCNVINLRNGLYRVSQDQLTPHTPDCLSTIQLALRYDPDADCPRFRAFLEEVMCGDKEQVRLIQEMLGYCLLPGNRAQKCFILVGEGGAGKSVLLNVIGEILLGRDNVSHVSWQALNEKFKTAELVDKLANIFADLPTKNIEDNGMFKALVGEDFLTVERKFKQPFSFRNNAKIIFSCNGIPKNYGDRSDGFYRRLIIIRFKQAVPEERCDSHLLDKLRAEADGIFLFALDGLRRLIANQHRFSVTQTNRNELQRYASGCRRHLYPLTH